MQEHSEVPERWLPVAGYPAYEVSNLGRVRSIPRTITGSDGIVRRRRGNILKPGTGTKGHQYVNLFNGGTKQTTKFVHHLVLVAFVGPRPDGTECCHNNGDPSDNRLSNLRWGTSSDNHHDMVRHGRHAFSRRTHCAAGHLLEAPNIAPSVAYRSGRTCLACRRTRSRIWELKQAGRPYDRAAIAAACYAEIMTIKQ